MKAKVICPEHGIVNAFLVDDFPACSECIKINEDDLPALTKRVVMIIKSDSNVIPFPKHRIKKK